MTILARTPAALPAWVPKNARLYLRHIEEGLSIRELARTEGCHASTVSRQVRAYENRRDDPLIDEALSQLGRLHLRLMRLAPKTESITSTDSSKGGLHDDRTDPFDHDPDRR